MLKELFVSEVRIKILRTVLLRPNEQFHIRGLVREVATEINAVRRELQNLEKVGLFQSRKSGNRIYYTVNFHSSLYPEIVSLLAKSYGLGSSIIRNAKALGDVKFAMLSRAFASGRRKSSQLDVDLMVVGNVNLDNLSDLVRKEEELRNKEINYTVLGEEEFNFRKRKNDQFLMKVLLQSRVMLIGDEDEFCTLNPAT